MADGSKARLAVVAVAVFVVVFGGVRLLERARAASSGGGPARITIDPPPGSPPPSEAGGSPSSSAAGRLYVDVAGEVRRPGLYRVARGSRVAVAVGLAGGFTRSADSTQVNLAAPLQDGQQVIVPARGAASSSGAGGAGGKRPVSLSTASAEDLDLLDGIGPTLAQRIVQYRQAHGGFRSIDELRQVDGIGDKRFQQLKKALQP